jgi:hypothetical protein
MANLIPGHSVSLKCLGAIEGPRFLDGRTVGGTAGLAPNTSFPFTGTRWEVIDDGPNRMVLKCLGAIEGPRFLDGRTADGTVGLAPATDGIFTGAHWEIGNPRITAQQLTPAQGGGAKFKITCSGFQESATINIYVESNTSAGANPVVYTDGHGEFNVTLELPCFPGTVLGIRAVNLARNQTSNTAVVSCT